MGDYRDGTKLFSGLFNVIHATFGTGEDTELHSLGISIVIPLFSFVMKLGFVEVTMHHEHTASHRITSQPAGMSLKRQCSRRPGIKAVEAWLTLKEPCNVPVTSTRGARR